MELRSLKTQDLQEMIQEQIKLYILGKGMKVGHPFPTEKELSQRFGISRTAVREALRGLETLGIIEARQRNFRLLQRYRTSNRKEFIKQHKRLIEAIEKRDPELTKERMIEHFSEPMSWIRAQKGKKYKGVDMNRKITSDTVQAHK